MGIRAIAKVMRRDHSVISREIRRNGGRKNYQATLAQNMADKRKRKTNVRKLDKYPALKEYVVENLREDWSPEEIAGRLKDHPPAHLRGLSISHESIYDYIYKGEGRYEGLFTHLRQGRPKRRKKRSRKPRKITIPERKSIHERPVFIDKKERFGDWESDTMVFGLKRSALSVQKERKSQFIKLTKMKNKTSEETKFALIKTAESVMPHFLKSITFDNGGENACHVDIKREYGIDTYFCDAFASWQKGGVENANKLIRQYLPKKTNLKLVSEEEIRAIEEKLNNRPRKALNWLTPNEVIEKVVH